MGAGRWDPASFKCGWWVASFPGFDAGVVSALGNIVSNKVPQGDTLCFGMKAGGAKGKKSAMAQFTSNVTYDLTMEAEDPSGALASVEPPAYYDVPALNTVSFTITLQPSPDTLATMFSDTVFVVPTTLYGDGEVILAEWDLNFVVSVSL